jgi:hypothetical protein
MNSEEVGSGQMNQPWPPDYEFEKRASSRLLDVLIRAGLIGVVAVLCCVIFAPFLTLMVWAIIPGSHALSVAPIACPQDWWKTWPRRDHRGAWRPPIDRHTVCVTDEFVWRLHL